MTNTSSLSDLVNKRKVNLDTSKEIAFKVYFPRNIVKFKELSNSLCGSLPSDEFFY